MSLSASEVRLQEQELMQDANSLANTLGPMALPIFFVLWPILASVGAGVFLNWWYQLNPPLIAGWSVGWLAAPFFAVIEGYYTIVHFKRATKASWITIRYWMGGTKRHFDNDFKLDHYEPLGRALKFSMTDGKEIEGLPNPNYGFVNKPHLWMKTPGIVCLKQHYREGSLENASKKLVDFKGNGDLCRDESHYVDLAGDYLYEFHFRSKRCPVVIIALPDVPERLLSFEGNLGIVIDGGLMFETEKIAAISFVRCDFTSTELVPFVPIGVLTDYSQLAADVSEERAIVYVGPSAVEVAAKARDNYYANEYLRKWKDEELMHNNTKAQEVNLDKQQDERVAALAGAKAKIKAGIKHQDSTTSRRSRGWVKWVAAISIIVGIILLIRFA